MISKGPHLRDQPAEQRTHLTNELLNISPSLSCRLLFSFSFSFFMYSLFLACMSVFYQHFQTDSTLLRCLFSLCFTFSLPRWLYFCCHWGSLICVLAPTETVWADTSIDFLSTASSCSNKFISLHIKDQASCTHAESNRRGPCASGRDRGAHDMCMWFLIDQMWRGGAKIQC